MIQAGTHLTDSASQGLSELAPLKAEQGGLEFMLPAESLTRDYYILSFPP